MELLKAVNTMTPVLSEDATGGGAVGATSVAVAATPLLSSMVKRTQPPLTLQKKKKKKRGLGLREAFDDAIDAPGAALLSRASANTQDQDGVVSKLKNLERKERTTPRDTVTFGLEDDDGGLVRVVVKSDQATEFEKALQHFLGDDQDDSMEIAEVLYKLKDHFDIVDITWPEVEEDEEQETALPPGEDQGDLGTEEPIGDLPPMGDAAPPMDGTTPEADQTQNMLTQVIDMMRADADARKAEARAKEAEAKAREAQAIVQQAMAKVKQEEQYLDMDAYNKAKKDEDKEVRRLAQLAKWKHDMGQEQEGMYDEVGISSPMPASREDEEAAFAQPSPTRSQHANKGATVRTRVSPTDVAHFILNRVKK